MTDNNLLDVSEGRTKLMKAKEQLSRAKNEITRARAAGLTALADEMEPKVKDAETRLNRLINAYR